jgi:hypothetical protein
MNKKEKLLKNYIQIYRPILEREKKKQRENKMPIDFNYEVAA